MMRGGQSTGLFRRSCSFDKNGSISSLVLAKSTFTFYSLYCIMVLTNSGYSSVLEGRGLPALLKLSPKLLTLLRELHKVSHLWFLFSSLLWQNKHLFSAMFWIRVWLQRICMGWFRALFFKNFTFRLTTLETGCKLCTCPPIIFFSII